MAEAGKEEGASRQSCPGVGDCQQVNENPCNASLRLKMKGMRADIQQVQAASYRQEGRALQLLHVQTFPQLPLAAPSMTAGNCSDHTK